MDVSIGSLKEIREKFHSSTETGKSPFAPGHSFLENLIS